MLWVNFFKSLGDNFIMRGQYFSFDVIVALALFVLTFMFILAYWFSIHSVMETQYSSSQDIAQRIGNALMTPGIPQDWDSHGGFSYAHGIGIATNYTNPVLSENKWSALSSQTPDDIEEKLNSAGWHVCINLTVIGGSGSAGTAGDCSIPDSAYSTVYTRIGAANFTQVKPAVLKVIVWRDANTTIIS